MTESFLDLDMESKDCQTEEDEEYCRTKHYTDTILDQCGCLPFSMISSSNSTLCSPEQLRCVQNTTVDSSMCVKNCNGLVITSYSKADHARSLEASIPKEVSDYRKYKKIFRPKSTSGLKAYQWENKLRFVRIYFDTPTFDRITKDRAPKFMDILSAIGGTMGLLTGFSIISGVEILYFAAKIVWKSIKKSNRN